MLDAFYYVFTDQFAAASRAAVGGDGEFLELLEMKDGSVDWLLNVTTIVDALDEGESEVKRFESGRIRDVLKYSFRPEIVSDLRVFRLVNLAHQIFWTSKAVEQLRADGLEGLEFRELWSVNR